MPDDGRQFLHPHLTISESSCKCGQTKCDYGTKPNHLHPKLVKAFLALRAKVGGPLYAISCCRCWYDNNRGLVERGSRQGHPNSLHLNGRAMDVSTRGRLTGPEMARLARTIPEIGGIGVDKYSIHIDVGSKSEWYYDESLRPKPEPKKPIIKTKALPERNKKGKK